MSLTKIKGSKTVTQTPVHRQGKMRWSFEYADSKELAKYNDDGTKNVYCQKQAGIPTVFVPITNIVTAKLTDPKGNVVSTLTVPPDATVFQRRRVVDVNYFNRFHLITITAPAGYFAGRWYPERQVQKRVPEYTYSQFWLIGWRRREPDSSITIQYQAVYPDGLVETFDAWRVKPWLKEPQWHPAEQV